MLQQLASEPNDDINDTCQNSKNTGRSLPGDLAIWFFIYAELAVFGILFIAYAISRVNHPDIFADGYQHLNRTAGLVNTIALITASYFVVLAGHFIKLQQSKPAAYSLLAAIVASLLYVGVKLFEYETAFSAGYDLDTNVFYTFYFLLTMFHFAHVLLGMAILSVMLFNTCKGYYRSNSLSGFESGASYWHMVDLVWVILFPIVYVIH
ncbi:cytochrome c oxidase subunit 3 family protein [Aliikangiella sp. G2MR2-5]|uniref:cytochrome c oxidase subunit 3 family protein n=1 Tax=Aliikangiella sp. G2MR2-5 TaxID=2788943 RepID=UPI0018A8DA9D|nr:cytochrome c oxidase subunit 3 family protein [Aliikangiella sp. G2MR2-5]